MDNINSISAMGRDSAAEQGARPGSDHGSALYLPNVPPMHREMLEAHKARMARLFKPEPPQAATAKEELQLVITGNKASLNAMTEPGRDWLVAASNAMSTAEFMVTIKSIQRIVADYYGVGVMDLRSSRKTQPTTLYRQIAMYLCKELTTNSLPAIGRQFSNRDHTTVLHAFRKIDRLRKDDTGLDDQIKTLMATIIAKPEPASCE
jgi:hypothetical protein